MWMRWIVGFLAALSLACLWQGLSLLSSASSSGTFFLLGRDVSTGAIAIAVVYFGVLCERLAVVFGFIDARRTHRPRWSLVLVSLCLLTVLNSLFFAMRVRGLLTQRWLVLDLPPEEVTPVAEALLLGPIALAYVLFVGPGKRLLARWRTRQRPAAPPPAAPTVEATATRPPSPASRGPITPPLPLPAAT